MPQSSHSLSLAFGLSFEDLYSREGIVRLDAQFLRHLQSADAGLRARLGEVRADPSGLERKAASEFIIQLAPHVEDFVGELFGIERDLAALAQRHNALAPLYALKRKFVQKKAISGVKEEQANTLNGMALAAELESLFGEPLTESSYCEHVTRWLDSEEEHKAQLDAAAKYGAWAALSEAGREKYGHHSVLFRVPHKLDMEHLVPVETLISNGTSSFILPEHHVRHREGFKLTDAGMNLAQALDQANYCIKCHNQGKDSCSHGLREKDNGFKSSPFGVTLAGCPLDEKISEMNIVKARGNSVGALAIVTVDNPLCAATGHRM